MGRIGVGEIVIFAIVLFLYFIPAMVARKHKNHPAILVLNLLLGWTVLGWIGALIWALTDDGRNNINQNE